MIWRIAKKEFLLNVMTFKFAVGTTLCVLLTVVFVPILAKAYQERLKIYNENIAYNERELGKVTVYKNITPTVYRPPSVLAIFCEGLEKQLGNSATIEYDKVPEITSAAANHYLSIFSVFDVSLIFKIVISILALLVAYDAISGEREHGTLRLMLSNTAARHEVLLGKIVAGLMVLVVPVTIAFILGLLFILLFPMVELSGTDWLRLGLMFIASLVFIATIYNLGLFFSCLARRSAISLVLGLFLWIILAVVVPNGSAHLATQIIPVESEDLINDKIRSLHKDSESEFWKEVEASGKNFRPGSESVSDAPGRGGFGHGYVRSCNELKMYNETLENSIYVPIQIKYANKYAEVRDRYLSGLYKQTELANRFSRISPISLYENVMSALAGTDMAAFQQFVNTIKPYRNDIVEYIRSRTNNFTSSTFWTPCTEEEIKTRPSSDDPLLDLSDLPQFQYKADIVRDLRRAIPDLAFLIFGNVLFFAMTFVAFLRYDVR